LGRAMGRLGETGGAKGEAKGEPSRGGPARCGPREAGCEKRAGGSKMEAP
jgi:hypothetical protein